jgi:hypothetical protein
MGFDRRPSAGRGDRGGARTVSRPHALGWAATGFSWRHLAHVAGARELVVLAYHDLVYVTVVSGAFVGALLLARRRSATQTNTYVLSNMTPQASLLNEGVWAWLEKLVRDYAQTYGKVVVLTGSVLQPPIRTVPSGNMGLPTSDGTPEALTIVLPNLQRGACPSPGIVPLGTQAEPDRGRCLPGRPYGQHPGGGDPDGIGSAAEPECRRPEESRGVGALAEELAERPAVPSQLQWRANVSRLTRPEGWR